VRSMEVRKGRDLVGELGVDHLARVELLVGGHVEVAVATQVEEDDRRGAGGLGLERLLDRALHRVVGLWRGQDALMLGKQHAGLEALRLLVRDLRGAAARQVAAGAGASSAAGAAAARQRGPGRQATASSSPISLRCEMMGDMAW